MKKTQRYERRLNTAKLDAVEVMILYKTEIEAERARINTPFTPVEETIFCRGFFYYFFSIG